MLRKFIIACLKPLSFLPAILIMYIIFSFSAQNGVESGNLSMKVSVKIVEIGSKVLDKELSQQEIYQYAEKYHYYVRKMGHMTEYCILAVALSIPMYVYGVRGIWLFLTVGLICVAFAGADEYHQSFVAGRGPSVRDVEIDSVGALIGITGTQIVGWTVVRRMKAIEKKRRRRKSRRKRMKMR